ncbi:MAG: hypothetical protein FWC71_07795 [Defluviitaleaceae bacterium]|nr:hypothetical protein [Defluviitaleaceae bacterium]
MKRVLLQDSAQDRKQRMFIYVLAFVVMTATLGMFAWGHDGQSDDAYDADAAYGIVYECDAVSICPEDGLCLTECDYEDCNE